jgi:hypothetical protein
MKGDDETAARYWATVVDDTADPVTLQRMIFTFTAVGDRVHLEQAKAALAQMQVTP